MHFSTQGELFELDSMPTEKPAAGVRTGTFTNNMRLPVHRWFRYSAGFSAQWVEAILRKSHFGVGEILLDPFAGSATTLLCGDSVGVRSVGLEAHSFVYRVATAKLKYDEDPAILRKVAANLLEKAKSILTNLEPRESKLLVACYSIENLAKLESLRTAFTEDFEGSKSVSELIWLVITSILRECSSAGTAQWQYILPKKSKRRVLDPYEAFEAKIEMFAHDMNLFRGTGKGLRSTMIYGDTRNETSLADLKGKVRLIITSPPYPNNFDYADATRLEMTFWGEVKSWADLHENVRYALVRSCSQHTAAEKLTLEGLLSRPELKTIRSELTSVCEALSELRQTRAGKKSYDTMIAAYFLDLALVWRNLYPLCVPGAEACFVIGDSAPYGIHVPADRWLGELAVAAGFSDVRFEKLRDRNVKWKNRKHRVPLLEGNLWVRS